MEKGLTAGGWEDLEAKLCREKAELAKYDAANASPQWEAVVEYANGASVTTRPWGVKRFAEIEARMLAEKYEEQYGEPEWHGAQIIDFKEAA